MTFHEPNPQLTHLAIDGRTFACVGTGERVRRRLLAKARLVRMQRGVESCE